MLHVQCSSTNLWVVGVQHKPILLTVGTGDDVEGTSASVKVDHISQLFHPQKATPIK